MASEKETVALWSLAASIGLTAAKFVAGLITGSLGLLSEALHSALDAVATFITWIAVRFADRPPDDTHHFGHAKAEAVAALVTTGLLFVTVAWIVQEAVKRLLHDDLRVDTPWWALAVVVGSIVIDYNRARALQSAADRHGSSALAADALHFSSDMWSSAAVLVGLVAAWAGYPKADPLAALAVAGFVFVAAWRLGRQTLDNLLDAAPEGAARRIRDIGNALEGVLEVERVRLRPSGNGLYGDVDFSVRRTLPFDEVTAIRRRFEQAIRDQFPTADLSMTAIPVALDDETVSEKVMLLAGRRGVAVHHLTVQHIGERLSVSFDLEVDGALSLAEAHAIATELETAITRELGDDVEVESHIEPLLEAGLAGADLPAAEVTAIAATLARCAARFPPLRDIHDVRARRNSHGVFVTYHCRARPDVAVERVHDAVDGLETAIRAELPQVRRVIGHAEPEGLARH